MSASPIRYPLKSMFIHPLKSGTPLATPKVDVRRDGILMDRRLMVVDENNRFLTARELPRLFAIACTPVTGGYVFTAPGMKAIEVEEHGLEDTRVRVWNDDLDARRFDRPIDNWLSEFLGRPARLTRMISKTERPLLMTPGRKYTFADTGPVLLTCTASLDELNDRLPEPIVMQRFRPNLVLNTAVPWEEDRWQRVRIGEVEFEIGRGCDRCAMITIDPVTMQRSRSAEPLKTLSTYRKLANTHVYFGIYLVPVAPGAIYATDELEVLEFKDPPPFVDPAPAPPKLFRQAALGRYGAQNQTDEPRKISLECVAIREESPSVKTFRFRTERPVNYQAGQFVTIDVPHEDGKLIRSYTLSSSPSRPNDLSISVKREGVASNWLHDNMRVGYTLSAMRPAGHFHFMHRPGRKLLLLGAGSGMTPVISMARWIVDSHVPTDIVVHQSARSGAELLFQTELAMLREAASMPFRLSWNITGDDESAPPGSRFGRLNPEMVEAICPDVDERIVFCCGSDPFREAAKAMLAARKWFKPENFIEESFGGTVAPAKAATSSDREPVGVSVKLGSTGQTITGKSDNTLLEILRSATVPIQSGCQAGLCGACKCFVKSGKWRLSPSNVDPAMAALDDEEKSRGAVLACSCCPDEDMVVELA